MTTQIRRLAAVVLAGLFLSGCYTIRYTTNARPAGPPQSEAWQHGVLNGWLDLTGPINVQAVCGRRGIAVVENEVSVLNALLSAIVQGLLVGGSWSGTGNIYTSGGAAIGLQIWTPTTVRVSCAAEDRTTRAPAEVAPVATRAE